MYTTAYLNEREAAAFESCVSKGCLDVSSTRMPSKDKKPVLPFYQDTGYGFNISGSFDMGAFKSALTYEPRPDDLFIVTYPKCGTTWVQNIVGCIFREGKPFTSAVEFLSGTPFLEMAGAEAAKTMKRPGAIKLHLPFHLTPWSSKAKYIVVSRNPKDCCVSFFHHTRNIIGYQFKNGNFDDYFELFMEGKVDFGDYFDHLISWWEHRDDLNVLFLTYEDLKKDTRSNVLKIAEFMGEKYKDLLTKNEKILDDVIKYSSFDFMKQNLNRQVAELAAMPKDFVLNHPDIPQGLKTLLTAGDSFFDSDPNSITFVRKGIVGDYKNYLSPEQNQRLEEKFRKKTEGTGIAELWKDIIPPSKDKKPVLPFYQDSGYGFNICGSFDMDAFKSALAYEPRPDDLFIVTYPKCGTTWVQNIVGCIFREGKPFASAVEFLSDTPFLEMAGAEAAKTMKRPGAIKMHLPFHLTPWSSKAKYIVVSRNPKDCCVSFFHNNKNIVGYKFKDGNFDVFFDLFMEGKVDFGDYFDHLISWWEHRNDPNVLFLTYEDLKKDTRSNVLKIAEFMGEKYKDMLTKNGKILDDVIKHSSFDFMKQNLNRQVAELAAMPRDFVLNHPDIPQALKTLLTAGDSFFDPDPNSVNYVRKGIVGDYKNYLSPEQNQRLEEKFRKRTEGTGIAELWEDIMSTSSAPIVPSAKPFTQMVDGFPIPGMFPVENYRSALSYKPRPDDLFIATYPKCGTTWAQHILVLIFRQGEPLKTMQEMYVAAPYLEISGAEGAEKMPRPGAIKVHLPYHLAPGSSYCKYIYISRNPKDCCVSYFHHMRGLPLHGFNGTFDQFFEFFISGNIDYGDYFDHLLGWYAHRNDPNVLLLTYEQMKENPEEVVLKMASFIDDKLYAEPLRNDPEKMRKVIQYSSFKHMKEEVNRGMDEMLKMSKDDIMNSDMPDIMKKLFTSVKPSSTEAASKESPSQFIRKGIIGDWKNYFTPEQSRRLDKKFAERTKGTELPDLWNKYM